MSDVLEIVMEGEETEECISSEEMLSYLIEAEEKIEKEGKKVIVASEDAIALYPNIEIAEAAKMCSEKMEDTEI